MDDKIEPPEPIEGNAYDCEAPALAPDWETAIDRFEQSPALRRMFHSDLIAQFVGTKRQEVRKVAALSEEARRLLYLDRV